MQNIFACSPMPTGSPPPRMSGAARHQVASPPPSASGGANSKLIRPRSRWEGHPMAVLHSWHSPHHTLAWKIPCQCISYRCQLYVAHHPSAGPHQVQVPNWSNCCKAGDCVPLYVSSICSPDSAAWTMQ